MTDVYVEKGARRTFASAIAWPGWSRAGRDESSALESLFAYAPRYAKVVSRSRLGFEPPPEASDLVVVERVPGTTTTDFGAPDVQASLDVRPVDRAELTRMTSILRASWRAFDRAAEAASGLELRPGPRGGGRSLRAIGEHVAGAEAGYLGRLAWTAPRDAPLDAVRGAVLDALSAAVEHGVEERGPRGGRRWTARYFVRRVAWHALDHTWEIEDRTA